MRSNAIICPSRSPLFDHPLTVDQVVSFVCAVNVQSVGRDRHREYKETESSKDISVSLLSTTQFLFTPRQLVDNQGISQNAMGTTTDRSTQSPNSGQPSSTTSAGITKVGTTGRSARRRRDPTRSPRVPTQKVTNPPIGQFYARSTTEDGEILPIDPQFSSSQC